jgi:beta-fructofuranosidase
MSGDTFPIFHGGRWHLFHMMPPVIAHHVSDDLVHWEPRPIVVSPGKEGEPDSYSNATGGVVEHDGKFYLFYTGNQNICLATSDDLDHWAKHPGNPILEGDDKIYDRTYFRDAYVFYYEPEKKWWMLFGTRTKDEPSQRAGSVGLAKSRNLIDWKLCSPLWSPRIGPHCDCPQLIHHLNKWYLFYLQRNTRYRIAEEITGPFCRPPVRNLATPLCAAASRPAFDGKRWVTFPFVMRLADEKSDFGDWLYGGPLAIPRELVFQENGSIFERPVREMIEAVHKLPGGDKTLKGLPLAGRWNFKTSDSMTSEKESGGILLLPGISNDNYMEFEVTFPHNDMDFHMLLRTDPTLLRGYQMAIHPRSQQVSLRSISIFDNDCILVNRSSSVSVGKPIQIRVFLSGSILEVFLNDRISLTSRLYAQREGMTGFEFRDGPGKITNLFWRPF